MYYQEKTCVVTETSNFYILQLLIKKHCGYFISQITADQLLVLDTIEVYVAFKNTDDLLAFKNDWATFTTPIIERHSPGWRVRILRRLRGEIKAFKQSLDKAFK